jgi:hypothetical protein
MKRARSSILLATLLLLQSSLAFNVKPVVVVSRQQVVAGVSHSSRANKLLFLAQQQDVDDEEEGEDGETTPPFNDAASVSRVDTATTTKKQSGISTARDPLFGEIPVDGGLVVVIPAAVIAVVGFITSLLVAYNAHDTFSDQVSQVTSQDINTPLTLVKVENPLPVVDAGCRGLCSTRQDQQLEITRSFMEGIAKK